MGQWQDALGRWPQHVTHTASHPGCVPASPHLLALRTPRRRQDQFWPVDIYMQQKNLEHRDTVYSPEKNSTPPGLKSALLEGVYTHRTALLRCRHGCQSGVRRGGAPYRCSGLIHQICQSDRQQEVSCVLFGLLDSRVLLRVSVLPCAGHTQARLASLAPHMLQCSQTRLHHPASSKATGAVFPAAFAHFLSLCHILVILAIF